MGCGGSRLPTPRGSQHHHFGESTVYETRLCLEVEPVHRMVLFSQRRPPGSALVRVVLSFLQQGLERRLSPSTLKVYVAAICCQPRLQMDGKLVGKHDWVIRFLRGAIRLNPPRPPSIPSWDLSLVLGSLQQGPFELCKQSS